MWPVLVGPLAKSRLRGVVWKKTWSTEYSSDPDTLDPNPLGGLLPADHVSKEQELWLLQSPIVVLDFMRAGISMPL